MDELLKPHPLLAPTDANRMASSRNWVRVTGYIGPSTADDIIRVYPDIKNTAEWFDIPKAAIVHAEPFQSANQVSGAVQLLIKKEQHVIHSRSVLLVEKTEEDSSGQDMRPGECVYCAKKGTCCKGTICCTKYENGDCWCYNTD
jgi:hypothetical protein